MIKRIKRYIILFIIFIVKSGYTRANFLKKIKYFNKQGSHCFFQPWNFGTEPEMISFGENVHIASGVKFINHDITSKMFNYLEKNEKYIERKGEIVIGDNVFVGSNTLILYDVTIGNNVIIGAGSVVTKNIPSGTIAAGVPCKIIGEFDSYKMKLIERN